MLEFALQVVGLESDFQGHIKNQACVACICNPNTGVVGMEGFLGITTQTACLTGELQANAEPFLKGGGWHSQG